MKKMAKDILIALFKVRKDRRPIYSVRAFARDLGVSPTTLSQAMNGRREVSVPLIEKLLELQELSETDRSLLGKLVMDRKNRRKKSRTITVTLEQHEKISDWHHFAVMNLIKCEDFSSDPGWIAARLAVSKSDAERALENLKNIGLIEKVNGRWVRVKADLRFESDRNSASTKKTQTQLLRKAEEAMMKHDFAVRDLSGTMMAIDPELVPLARTEINKFRSYLAGKLEKAKPGKEVYHLAIQLFPVSRLKE